MIEAAASDDRGNEPFAFAGNWTWCEQYVFFRMRLSRGRKVFVIREFLSPDQCAELIAWAEDLGFIEAPINSAFGAVRAPEIRNNDRVIIDDQQLASALWPLALAFYPPLLHEGAEIVRGTKYVMRSDVMYRSEIAVRPRIGARENVK